MKTFAFAVLVALKVSLSDAVRLQMTITEVDAVANHPEAAAKAVEHGAPDVVKEHHPDHVPDVAKEHHPDHVPDVAKEHHPDHVPDAVKEHHPSADHTKAVAVDAWTCDGEAEKAFLDAFLAEVTCAEVHDFAAAVHAHDGPADDFDFTAHVPSDKAHFVHAHGDAGACDISEDDLEAAFQAKWDSCH